MGDGIMEFKEYLLEKHNIIKGERKLQPVSVKQYINRLDSMRKNGIYNEEEIIDSVLKNKIQQRYKDWKTYVKTIEHYF